MKSIERLLKEKKKLSRLYHETPHVDSETEEQIKDYMQYLNETICKVIDIQYKEDLMNSFRTPNKIAHYE